jgi:hypothetical protein
MVLGPRRMSLMASFCHFSTMALKVKFMGESWIVRSSRMTRIHDGAHRNGPLRPGMRYFGIITTSTLAVPTLTLTGLKVRVLQFDCNDDLFDF